MNLWKCFGIMNIFICKSIYIYIYMNLNILLNKTIYKIKKIKKSMIIYY